MRLYFDVALGCMVGLAESFNSGGQLLAKIPWTNVCHLLCFIDSKTYSLLFTLTSLKSGCILNFFFGIINLQGILNFKTLLYLAVFSPTGT